MEDGQAPSPANARASNKTPKALETAEKLSSTFAESMKSSMIVLADALRTQNESPKTQPEPKETFCADVGEHLDLIQSLEEQISKIRSRDDFESDTKARKRVKRIEKVLDKVYSKLDDGDDDSDTSDEE